MTMWNMATMVTIRGSTKNYAVETTAVLTDMEQVQKLYPSV